MAAAQNEAIPEQSSREIAAVLAVLLQIRQLFAWDEQNVKGKLCFRENGHDWQLGLQCPGTAEQPTRWR